MTLTGASFIPLYSKVGLYKEKHSYYDQGPYSSTILRLFLTWILNFSQAFTNFDQNGIHQHSQL